MALLAASMVLLVLLIVKEGDLKPPILRPLGFVALGAVVGSVLYQIRVLFRFYIRHNEFDPRWLPKYFSAPIEAIALALAILALLEGGGAALGAQGLNIEGAKSFTIFGLGALIGFGIREVVGWLGNLAKSTFPTEPEKEPKKKQSASRPTQ
jgi:hypothetical protein